MMSLTIEAGVNASVMRTWRQAEATGSAINRFIHYFMTLPPPQLADSEACTKVLIDGEDLR